MRFLIRVYGKGRVAQKACPGNRSPRDYFAKCVRLAVERGELHVELIKVNGTFGKEIVLDSWTSSKAKIAIVEGHTAAYKYKVHSARGPLGTASPSSSNHYYDTLEEAQAQAEKCVQTWNKEHEGCIIYKAVKFVRRDTPPILVEDID